MNDEGGRRLFRFELERLRERDPDPLRANQIEQFDLVLQIRAGGITERVAATAIVLLENLGHIVGILVGDAPNLPDPAMEELGERLCRLDAETVQEQVILILTGF